MTTITIQNGQDLKKTNFLNIDELISYLLKKEGYGVLHSLDEKEITSDRKKRFNQALNTDKSKMQNI